MVSCKSRANFSSFSCNIIISISVSMLSAEDIAKHNTTSCCWLVINGKVYDVTVYLDHHPGGAAILLKQGGQDATAEFRKIHNPDILQYLPEGSYLGEVDSSTIVSLPISSEHRSSSASSLEVQTEPPHISRCVVANDFEKVARSTLSEKSWSYVSSSANSAHSHQGNLSSWTQLSFRPRILRNVRDVHTRSAILGTPTALPFYVSAMGHLGRAHSGGEIGCVRGLARRGVHGLLSSVSTQTTEEIMDAFVAERKALDSQEFPPAQLHFQLYIPANRDVAVGRIRRARKAGFKSLWVTVDTPYLGKRTLDRRLQAQEALDLGLDAEAEKAAYGLRAHVSAGQFHPELSWQDLEWIKAEWGGGPIVLKGIQCAEDARLAVEYGCQGILLSNHGGRQAHSAPDALTTLLEIRTYCPEVLDKLEVFVDGGCRDGADVLKALCLGATAVGIGRPFFYALGAYGTKGVERCIDILSEELLLGMKLTGISTLKDARPELVNASKLLNDMWRPEIKGSEKSRL
ncbi:FMN-dependent dehydrogenase-domain-containing protein [Xylariaceae sp. FL0016]|nr:FMN-dependent dehydrogenase-domain-containing protein [Xylariaceae sp. FL0016]